MKNRTKGERYHEKKKVITLIAAALAFTMTVCGSSTAIAASELTAESKPATQYTIDANQEVYVLLVFADPENTDARYLCADALEQLGYHAESGPWRSAYLSEYLLKVICECNRN